MPRIARVKSDTGMYHILVESNPDELLFKDNEDRYFFLERLHEKRIKYQYKILAYCLLDQAYHLVIHEHKSQLSTIMKSINVSYASFVHKKYGKQGSFFKDRYRSECLNNVSDILDCIAHVHLQPIELHLVNRLDQHQWSSYGDYIAQGSSDLIDKDMVYSLYGLTEDDARKEFIDSHHRDHRSYLKHEIIIQKKYPTLLEARELMYELLDKHSLNLQTLFLPEYEKEREFLIHSLRELTALSINDISHELGIKRSQVMHALYHK
jgi:REP element-mobilizing transposase RayT